MFFHNFKYAIKTLLKNKILIFWTFAFPIILGTFFYMAFSNIENSEKLDIIPIVIVQTEEFKNNTILKETFKQLGDETSTERLFDIKYTTEEEAISLLEEETIIGYLLFQDKPQIVLKSSGIYETVLKYVTEEIYQIQEILKQYIETNTQNIEQTTNISSTYIKIYQNVINMMQESISIKDTSSENLSYTMIEFYTLIAMTCLYGGILGMVMVNQNLANMSANGKRVAISPVAKGKLILSSVLASYIIQLIGITLLFLYTILILHVDYGNHLYLIILLTLIGCLAGLSLGIMVATLFKTNDNTKTGIIIAITMLGCFFSGMMGITMKYMVDTHIPIINLINPANMITDGFYSLYYYDTFNRYYFNIICLVAFSLLMIILSIMSLRRQKYDSI